jgi:hypothetical protein
MTGFRARPLDETTWPDFARLVERHNGVWGGCWCMGFHAEGVGRTKTVAQNRSEKECRVREGRAHTALVYDGPACVGWCQFGPADEPPSSTGAPTSKVSALFRTGGSRASSPTASTGAKESPPPRSKGPCTRSRGWGEARSRATRKMPKAGRSPHRFSTAAWCRCSKAMGSSEPVASVNITGWSPRSCPEASARTPACLEGAAGLQGFRPPGNHP